MTPIVLAATLLGSSLAAAAPPPDAATDDVKPAAVDPKPQESPTDGPPAAEPDAAPPAEDPSTQSQVAEDPAPSPTQEVVPADEGVPGPRAIDKILPSGVRVIVATDNTLPVASVVLAIERGSEDDPEGIAGLHHALAYHLLQGNRETAPGGIARLVHDGGGVTNIASGPAQIRFESLVPVSTLAELVTAESQRLRAPTVVDSLWKDTLIWARRDPARSWGAPLAALAAAHGVPRLARNGRQVSAELAKLDARSVAAALADRFRYERATLVVVGPHPPDTTLALLDALFSDLPPRTRHLKDRKPKRAAAQREVAVKGADGSMFVWPVDPKPAAVAWAKVWCKTINRQRRAKTEDRRARLRCRLDEDPRRPLFTLRATGVDDPWALAQARLGRIANGDAKRLVEKQLAVVRDELLFEVRTPLGLARALARSRADAPRITGDKPERAVRALTGIHDLTEPDRFPSIADAFPPTASVRVIPATKD